jgi:hypothetical protein
VSRHSRDGTKIPSLGQGQKLIFKGFLFFWVGGGGGGGIGDIPSSRVVMSLDIVIRLYKSILTFIYLIKQIKPLTPNPLILH